MSVSRPPMRQRMAQQSRVASLVMAIEQIHRQDGGRAAPVAFVRAPPNVVSQRMRVLAQVYELLVRNRRATKRDLYYEHKKLYGTQINFNRALTALCKQLSASRSELHVISCSRGFAIGNLRLFDGMDDDSVVDFRASPVAIVESLCHFSLVHSEAQFLLVVEKDAIFQRLIDEQFLHKFPRGILLTGRGYPDFCTRQFLHWLSVQLPALPMLALVDADPYGVEIFLTYKYGSSRSIVEAGAFHLPRLRWLGFLPSEAQKLPIPSNQCLQLSEKDRKRIERIAQRTNGHGEEERSLFNYELSVMLNSSQKLELEALCSISANYLSTVYLDNKLLPLNVSVAQPYDGNNNVERVQNGDFGNDQNDDFECDRSSDFGGDQSDDFGIDRNNAFGGDQDDDFGGDQNDGFGSDQNDGFGSDRNDEFGGDQNDDFGDDQEGAFGSDHDFGGDQDDGFGSDQNDDFGSDQNDDFGGDQNDDFGGDQEGVFESDHALGDDQNDDFGSDQN